jgi:hypothetical protein
MFFSNPVLPAPKEVKKDGQAGPRKDDESPFEMKPPIKHVLSKELQVCSPTDTYLLGSCTCITILSAH